MSEDADAFWREADARARVMRKLAEVLERIPPGAVDVLGGGPGAGLREVARIPAHVTHRGAANGLAVAG